MSTFKIPRTDRSAIYDENSLALKIIGENAIPKRQKAPAKYRAICFKTTTACNFGCTYCVEEESENNCASQLRFDPELAIDFLEKYCPPENQDQIALTFMGGEPTLNMDFIYKIVEHCKLNYLKARFSITTNGVTLSNTLSSLMKYSPRSCHKGMTVAEYIQVSGFGITLSLDGPQAVQDSTRVYKDGRGTFDDVMRNLEYTGEIVPDLSRRIQFRATYDQKMADSEHPFVERLKFFNSLINRGIGRSVFIAPAAFADVDAYSQDQMEKIREQYYDAAEWLIDEVRAGHVPSWNDFIPRTLLRLVTKKRKSQACGAGSGYFTVEPDGKIFACHRTAGAGIGTIEHGIDQEALSKWAGIGVSMFDKCKACHIRGVCGGDCGAVNVLASGDTLEVGEFGCFIRKSLFECGLMVRNALGQQKCEEVVRHKHGRPAGR